MTNRLKKSFGFFLALSLLVHLGFLTSLISIKSQPKVASPKPASVEIEIVPAQTVEEALRKQIVQQEKRINDEKPEDAEYLSQFDQTVKKQTRADRSGEFKNTAQPGARKSGQKQVKNEDPNPPTKRGELPSLKKLKPQFTLNPKVFETDPGKAGDPSQTDDHLKDVPTGIQTLLSTREFVYYSYYTRIREQIRQHWAPTVREKVKVIYRSGRTIASAGDRVTQVIVILDAQGVLEEVQVIGESGVKDLDDAAIEAFRAAAPFPNPPKGIVEKDGRIRIRWDFILEA
ncbi:MAG: TonB family protein [Bdellovibrionales bacterium]|nr:TonB family protein [Bdellovibrionales bacterium]